MIRYFNILVFIFYCSTILGQSNYFQDKSRWVSIENNSGECRFEVLTSTKNKKTNQELPYLWYDRGNLNQSQGSYSGYLLDGDFIMFYKTTKNLKEKGEIKAGLRTGIWLEWSEDGSLIRAEIWRKGLKQGKCIEYDSSGQVKTIYRFKKGKLHGRQRFYEDGKKVKVERYRKGKAVTGSGLKLIDKIPFLRKRGENEKKKDDTIKKPNQNKQSQHKSKQKSEAENSRN